jgi:hypothetical protein
VNSHFLIMVIFALLTSTVFAVIVRDEPRAQIRTGAKMFAAFVGLAIAFGWLMYPLPL